MFPSTRRSVVPVTIVIIRTRRIELAKYFGTLSIAKQCNRAEGVVGGRSRARAVKCFALHPLLACTFELAVLLNVALLSLLSFVVALIVVVVRISLSSFGFSAWPYRLGFVVLFVVVVVEPSPLLPHLLLLLLLLLLLSSSRCFCCFCCRFASAASCMLG